MKNSLYLIVLCVIMLFTCVTDVQAQGVKLYKNNGTTIDISDADLDSIVSVASEELNKVYRNDGKVFKVLFSELDSIVAFGGYEDNVNFVDLGLSVMWASRNLGAEKPEDSGDYFAWGEISPKSSYTKENSETAGKSILGISSDEKFDAARSYWGESARIPTLEEYDELCNKCEWQWTTINGVNGQLITGPNGNKIFIPAAGIRRGTSLDDVGVNGNYWTANPYESDNYNAYNHIFNSSGFWGSIRPRGNGLPIRPVSGVIQCIPYTGDTIKVDEFAAQLLVSFAYVPSKGIIGGVECTSATTGKKKEQRIDVKEDGDYVLNIEGLERGTKYRYRSFVIVNDKYIYGKAEEFITKNTEDNLTKGEWIDLGLSVKWASHNIGAPKPEDYGDYYAWGEIYPKQMYDEDNCETLGKTIADISGDSDYDAASANWGGASRMPTEAEMKELCEKCTWEWTPRNGVNGMLITGPNGNTIFLPASGLRLGPALDYEEKNGFYWSSTPDTVYVDKAYGITFNKGGVRGSCNNRSNGRVIRPVSE